VKTIHLNGVPTEVEFASVTGWNIDIGLSEGVNRLTVEGYDRQGNLIDLASDTITVTFTDSDPSPEGQVVINEIMYHPDASDAEFIEIHNLSETDVFSLSGWRLDGVDFTFAPGSLIQPGEYLLLAENSAAFALIYEAAAYAKVIGEYGLGGSLSNGGETLRLLMPDAADQWITIDEVSYGDDLPWPLGADGDGPSLQLMDPTRDNNHIGNWAVGDGVVDALYTPGEVNSVDRVLPSLAKARINEIQPNNAGTLADNLGDYDPWIEIYNVGLANFDNCYLTDDYTDLTKWAFTTDVPLESGEYRIVWADGETEEQTSTDDLHSNFVLNPVSGGLALVWDYAGAPIVLDYLDYGYVPPDRTEGRWPDGEGKMYLMSSPTAGSANSSPYVGPVVINEIMYHPPEAAGVYENDLEFIELYNSSEAAIPLDWYDYDDDGFQDTEENVAWRLDDAVEFDFPAGTIIQPGRSLIVVGFDPSVQADLDLFEATYGLGDLTVDEDIVGGWSGNLGNEGERVQLERPHAPPPEQPALTPYIQEDEADYDDDVPWPTKPDGTGDSLNRQAPDLWGNDPTSWVTAVPTPGSLPSEAVVVGRRVFYDNSRWDGFDPGPGASDDAAIAIDKSALLPGDPPATFANYTSYSRGINGVMIDVKELADAVNLGPDDFEFRVGNDYNSPAGWAIGPQPLHVRRRILHRQRNRRHGRHSDQRHGQLDGRDRRAQPSGLLPAGGDRRPLRLRPRQDRRRCGPDHRPQQPHVGRVVEVAGPGIGSSDRRHIIDRRKRNGSDRRAVERSRHERRPVERGSGGHRQHVGGLDIDQRRRYTDVRSERFGNVVGSLAGRDSRGHVRLRDSRRLGPH